MNETKVMVDMRLVRPCPECGEKVEYRKTELGFHYRIPAIQYKLGPEHNRRCVHYRKQVPNE